MPPALTLLSRDECHLCEEFEQELLALLGPQAGEVRKVAIEERLDWLVEYGKRIPVLLDGQGRVVCEGHFDPAAVRRALPP